MQYMFRSRCRICYFDAETYGLDGETNNENAWNTKFDTGPTAESNDYRKQGIL